MKLLKIALLLSLLANIFTIIVFRRVLALCPENERAKTVSAESCDRIVEPYDRLMSNCPGK